MNIRLLGSKASALSLIAITVFFFSMLFAGYRLIQIERNFDYNLGEDMAWTVGQAQFENMRFLDALSRFVNADGLVSRDDLNLRLDILLSRLGLFETGQPRAHLVDVGVWDDLIGRVRAFNGLEASIRQIAPGDHAQEQSIRTVIEPLTSILRDANNTFMLSKRSKAIETQNTRRVTMIELVIYMLGTMISGMVLGFFIIRSHREIVRAEASLKRERELSRIYRSLISTVSHQFRTPLAIIDSNAQRMVRRGAMLGTEEIATRISKIRDAITRLVLLMESTLNAARIDAGEISCKPREADLARLLTTLCERQGEIDPERKLIADVSGLPQKVLCDPVLMEQALTNLISNALKYSASPEPVYIRAWSNAGKAMISVEDRGIGIPEDEIPHIFEHFFRARTAEGIPGTGLGLSFARHIAKLHGGDISLVSREKRGSTFTISFPLKRSHPVPVQDAA